MAKTIVFKLQIEGPEISREVTLKHGVTTLGREPSNDIQLNFPKVSRRHARFECTETMCIVIDQESANGTLVNGERIAPNVPIPLHDNSIIEIDPVKIICRHIVAETPDDVAEKPPEQKTISRKQAQAGEQAKPKPEPEKPVEEAKPEPKEEKKPEKPKEKKAQPPPEPPSMPPESPQITFPEPEPKAEQIFPPGLSEDSIRYIDYLPGIYQNDFMSHFMAMFESILMPMEWNVDNFDMFLSPATAPKGFLPWLSQWYSLVFDLSWSEKTRRMLLIEAHQIYARRGTRWALMRLLEIYTGQTPEIIEFEKEMDAHTFKVILKENKNIDQNLVIRLIDASKPAHTSYAIEFTK